MAIRSATPTPAYNYVVCLRRLSRRIAIHQSRILADQLRQRRRFELGKQVGPVGLYRARRERQRAPDLLVGQAFDDQAQDLALTG